ncbi:glycosyltransferase family 2 protein [Pedobacter duraquae]|uniref:GT2 family glycosyltransferase n=1 Tax=Pedobacter duraquae TaxID=425511 RepID=A0A4R6IIZ5_9SPHI|nr:glycosyltransferase family 2 protein [Pedobacter duraquae]TDO21969.1 GT2 family glycosyltransferase [Pedobacter duraquae]
MEHNILLSICIPTYNRADILDSTLKRLFDNPEFMSDCVEVVVSDNGSTDHTREVVSKYPLVRYYCNTENIRDLNFSKVLSFGRGKYIKLFNDTLNFNAGVLTKILRCIETNSSEEKNIFFYDKMFLNKTGVKEVDSAEAFINEVSFYSTWIANFGCWRSEFRNIPDKDRYVHLQLAQVDWSYRIVKNGQSTMIFFGEYYDITTVENKGGYNVFDVFVRKYLFIIHKQNLSLFSYEREKFRLCYHFVYPWIIKLYITDINTFSFSIEGAFKTIFAKYWYEPYFYLFFGKYLIHKIIKRKSIS